MPKILIIDDDTELCELVCAYLQPEGFDIGSIFDGEGGLAKAIDGDYDIIILDVMLPRLGGFEILRRLRATSSVPVIMLTARGDDVDRIVGLEIGADDYLPKPFNPRELTARIRAVLRRSHAPVAEEQSQHDILHVDDIEIDMHSRTVTRSREQIELTSVEFNVLEILLRSAGNVVTREYLVRNALGRRFMRFDRGIDMHVSNLRRKLGAHNDGSERIKTIRGSGYFYALQHQPKHLV